MLRTRHYRFASLGLGAGTGGTLYWFGIDILLSSAITVALAVSVALLFRINRDFPDKLTGNSWEDGRWTAVSLTVTNFAALVGVQWLPLSDGYHAAVSLLVILIGLSAYLGGSLAEMERDRPDNDRTDEDTTVPEGD